MKIGILSRIKSNEYLLIICLFIPGINLMFYPDWNLGLFAGIGFFFTGLGINKNPINSKLSNHFPKIKFV